MSTQVPKNKAVLDKTCLPMATLTWTLTNGSQGALAIGDKAFLNGEVVMDGSMIDRGSTPGFPHKPVLAPLFRAHAVVHEKQSCRIVFLFHRRQPCVIASPVRSLPVLL